MSSIDKDVARAYSALRNPRPCRGVTLTMEDGVPVFRVPVAISGSEIRRDPRLKKPKIDGGFRGNPF